MKYIGIFLFFIIMLMPINIKAFCLSELDFETKVSAFLPSSKVIRHIYSDVMPYYELEIGKTFCNNWEICLGAGYLSNDGHAIGCKYKTSFRLIPISLGLKYFYSLSPCIDLYTGAGICWSFLNNKDDSLFVHKHISNQALGGIFKLGCVYYIKECIFIDIFTEYFYQKFSFKRHYDDHYTLRHNLNMSGLKIGGGIGFDF